MNWYKKAQTYENITSYPEEYSDNFDAHRYFSIGQNEETTKDSFCWIWHYNELLVDKGPTTHRLSFGYLFNNKSDVEDYYRGWYDPIQDIISVVMPKPWKPLSVKFTENDMPSILRRSLLREFSDTAQIIVF